MKKLRFSKRALEKDPLDWFKDNNKKVGDVITTRIHEVLKTGVKVSIDKEKKFNSFNKKNELAKDASDQDQKFLVKIMRLMQKLLN